MSMNHITPASSVLLPPRATGERAMPVSALPYQLKDVYDIAVEVDGSARDELKLVYAEMLAVAAGAHLTAFYANHIPLAPVPPGPGSEWIIGELWENGRKVGDTVEAKLKPRLERIDAITEIRRYDDMIGGLAAAAARLARTTDVFILGRPYGQERHWPEILEAVLFDASKPVLVVPPTLATVSPPRTIVVGWRDTRDCARAVDAAMPFLHAADSVYLVSVPEGDAPEERHREPAADMARHLARHDIDVELRTLPHWHDAAEGLMNEATIVGADLIVAGGYGRSRYREMIWGGVTRSLLTESQCPVLLAH